MANFTEQVSDWCANSKDALETVFHESAQRVVAEMQTPGPSKASVARAAQKGSGLGKNGGASKRAYGPVNIGGGGNLPVDTGFLWHSLLASSESMPKMRDDAKPTEGAHYSYDAGPVSLVINGTPLGKTLFVGYTAVYAAKVNYSSGYLFVEKAAQKWPQIVKTVEAELRARLG